MREIPTHLWYKYWSRSPIDTRPKRRISPVLRRPEPNPYEIDSVRETFAGPGHCALSGRSERGKDPH
jgi:hypothetical protein